MAGSTFIDSNVLIYMFDGKYPEKKEQARATYRGLDPNQIVLSTQVLQEFYWNVTRKVSPAMTLEEATSHLRDFCVHVVVTLDEETIFAGVERSAKDRIAFWDALIVEAALAADCERLLTEDLQDGREFDGMRVVNPFRKP